LHSAVEVIKQQEARQKLSLFFLQAQLTARMEAFIRAIAAAQAELFHRDQLEEEAAVHKKDSEFWEEVAKQRDLAKKAEQTAHPLDPELTAYQAAAAAQHVAAVAYAAAFPGLWAGTPLALSPAMEEKFARDLARYSADPAAPGVCDAVLVLVTPDRALQKAIIKKTIDPELYADTKSMLARQLDTFVEANPDVVAKVRAGLAERHPEGTLSDPAQADSALLKALRRNLRAAAASALSAQDEEADKDETPDARRARQREMLAHVGVHAHTLLGSTEFQRLAEAHVELQHATDKLLQKSKDFGILPPDPAAPEAAAESQRRPRPTPFPPGIKT
jgi:hypothetical protein